MDEYIKFNSDNGVTILMPTDKRKPIKYRVAPRDMVQEELQELGETLLALVTTGTAPVKTEPRKKPAEKAVLGGSTPVLDKGKCAEKDYCTLEVCEYSLGIGAPPENCPQLKKS